MRSELRFAVRHLTKEPALAIAAIVMLALGIGTCTAVFSIVEAVLLKPMDVAQPERLAIMWPQIGDAPGEFAYNAYRELSRPSSSFEDVALKGSVNWPVPVDILLPNGGRTRATQCAVSDTFFDVLGARPLLGRTFHTGDDYPGAPAAIVVSAEFWRTRLGADPAMVGRMLTMFGPVRIIGVMPPEFFYPTGADIWTLAAGALRATSSGTSPDDLAFTSLGAFHVLARLKPGVSMAQARTEATNRWRAVAGTTAVPSGRVAVTPFLDHVFGSARRALWILMGAVCLVLVLACANVAGLLIARNALREQEFAVKRALGATAGDVVRQHLVEGGVLAVVGALLGFAITTVSLRALTALSPVTVVRLSDARIDSLVLAACILITAAVTTGIGLLAATQFTHTSAIRSMHALTTREMGRGLRSETRRALVVGQVAISVTLLVASVLTGQSFRNLAALDLGFEPSNVLTLDLSRLDQSRYPTSASRHRAIDDLMTNVRRLPNVQAVAAVLNRPFAHGVVGWDSGLLLEGQEDVSAIWRRNPTVNFEAVTPGYFDILRILVREGRDFSTGDGAGGPRVAVISDALATQLWPGQNPIGRHLLDSYGRGSGHRPPQWRTIIGVVSAAHYRDIEKPGFDLYVPLAQATDFDPEDIVVKTDADPHALIRSVAAMLAKVDPQLTSAQMTTMDDVVSQARAPWRFNMLLLGSFGCMSIGLTVIGVAGLVVSTVNGRRREIGVRLAVGAQTRDVVSLIGFEGARLIAAGVGLGIVCSLLTSQLLASLLFGVAATDPRALLLVAGVVFGCGALALYVPARRAAKLDPSSLFREP